MTLQIFSACVSDSDPPKTVKSWLKTNTSRPSMVPCPVTTPSPRIALLVETEVGRTMGHERIELHERARIEQQVQSLTRRQLAARMLLVDPLLTAAESRLRRAWHVIARSAPGR